MSSPETQILQTIERRAKRKSSTRIYDGGHRGWVPNPDRVVNPMSSLYWSGKDCLEGFDQVRIADLHSLKPEDLLVFNVSVVCYLIRMEEDDRLTAWINTSYGGLTAPIDNLSTVALARTRKKELDKLYPGALMVNGFHRKRTRIAMPYFSFDRLDPGRVQTPKNAWIDSVNGIWIKRNQEKEK